MNRNKQTSLLLSPVAWQTLLLDAYQRQHIEACGALLGNIDEQGNWQVEAAHPLRNACPSAVYFEFDPAELLLIELEQPGRMIGVYHSHPTGPTRASSTDRKNMQRVNLEQEIPWVWLIVSGPFRSQEAESQQLIEPPRITARGDIAYYHHPDSGLQHIELQHTIHEEK